MRALDPSAVLAFVEVVRQRSFRGAAQVLGLSKSTVSQRVAALEDYLGARLLSRTTRRVQLTDIGARYHGEVEPALEALRSAEARVGQLRSHPSGRLRMSTPVDLGHEILGDVLARYSARCPDVTVEVLLTDRTLDLVEEGFDLAIRIGPLADSSLVARSLASGQALGLFASPEYLKRHGTPREPTALSRHRCLVMSGARDPTAWRFSIEGKLRRIQVSPHMLVNSFSVLRAVAVAGGGIVRMPVRYAERDVQAKRLRPLLRRYTPPVHSTLVVYPSARHVSPALRAMIDLLAESPNSKG
jgi:DNA-binding transcriptional LysR family regulator